MDKNSPVTIASMCAKILSIIGSVLWASLLKDECKANKLRVSYAKILVEVDVTQELTKKITIKDSERRKMKQSVE